MIFKKAGIEKIIGNSCNCGNSKATYTYNLPIGLDISILEFLISFEQPSISFEKKALLKIENNNYSIIGIRRLKQIKLVIKNNDHNIVEQFENALILWLESRKK